jgi:hypothetical protein
LCAARHGRGREATQTVTEETAMDPTIHYELMQARVADLHRDAERDRLAQAASRSRRPRHQRDGHPVTAHPTAMFVRRALAALGARSL